MATASRWFLHGGGVSRARRDEVDSCSATSDGDAEYHRGHHPTAAAAAAAAAEAAGRHRWTADQRPGSDDQSTTSRRYKYTAWRHVDVDSEVRDDNVTNSDARNDDVNVCDARSDDVTVADVRDDSVRTDDVTDNDVKASDTRSDDVTVCDVRDDNVTTALERRGDAVVEQINITKHDAIDDDDNDDDERQARSVHRRTTSSPAAVDRRRDVDCSSLHHQTQSESTDTPRLPPHVDTDDDRQQIWTTAAALQTSGGAGSGYSLLAPARTLPFSELHPATCGAAPPPPLPTGPSPLSHELVRHLREQQVYIILY